MRRIWCFGRMLRNGIIAKIFYVFLIDGLFKLNYKVDRLT